MSGSSRATFLNVLNRWSSSQIRPDVRWAINPPASRLVGQLTTPGLRIVVVRASNGAFACLHDSGLRGSPPSAYVAAYGKFFFMAADSLINAPPTEHVSRPA